MSSPLLEQFLARIYVDPQARARFLADPQGEAAKAGLPADQCLALKSIDRVGLEMAARSYSKKRQSKSKPRSLWSRLFTAP